MSVSQLPPLLFEALESAAVNKTVRIAYSGGLDSRFLAFCAKLAGFDVVLLHIEGPHVSPNDTQEALRLAEAMGLSVQTISLNPLDHIDIRALGHDRCYACKRLLFQTLLNRDPTAPLCDGSNASDANVFRPGARAVKELSIISPLALAGLTKNDIRQWGTKLGLPYPEQRARPCLLTRFPYGTSISTEQLRLIARVEAYVAAHPTGKRLAFRLRMPTPALPELHVQANASDDVPAERLDALVRDLKKEFPALTDLRCVQLADLSGFYDKSK